jgi:hypothetical protein
MRLFDENILIGTCLFIEDEFERLIDEEYAGRQFKLKSSDFVVCLQLIVKRILHKMKLTEFEHCFSLKIALLFDKFRPFITFHHFFAFQNSLDNFFFPFEVPHFAKSDYLFRHLSQSKELGVMF